MVGVRVSACLWGSGEVAGPGMWGKVGGEEVSKWAGMGRAWGGGG